MTCQPAAHHFGDRSQSMWGCTVKTGASNEVINSSTLHSGTQNWVWDSRHDLSRSSIKERPINWRNFSGRPLRLSEGYSIRWMRRR